MNREPTGLSLIGSLRWNKRGLFGVNSVSSSRRERKTVPETDYPRSRDGIWQPDRARRETDPGLPVGMAFIVMALLSLGLWWVIWAAFSSLALVLLK
jgi:hypothetical protein